MASDEQMVKASANHDKPRDHVIIGVGGFTRSRVNYRLEKVFFARYVGFEDLPPVVQCESVRADFEAYKTWERIYAR